MDIRQLKYFHEIVTCNSFTLAAQRLHITQPTISKAIKSMEEEIGGPLFTREGKLIRLTDIGEVVMKHSSPILAQFDQLTSELSDLTYLNSGKLTIGLPPMAGARFFPAVIKQFHDAYPGINIRVVEAGATKIGQEIERGELDAGVLLWPIDEQKYHYVPLASEKLKVLLHPEHKLITHKQLRLEQLIDESFIMFNQDFALHERIVTACKAKGFTPKIVTESSQWDFIGQMVAANLGIAMLPSSICELLDPHQVFKIPLVEPTIHWELVLAWKKDMYMTLAAQTWITFATSLFRQHSHN